MANRKLKILVLSHTSSILGGAERSMIDTFDYLSGRYDIEPEFIIRLPLGSMTRELEKRGWKYHALDYTFWSDGTPPTKPDHIFNNVQRNNKAILDIEKIIENSKPDVVITNSIVCPWAAIAAYFQKVPHVWFVREYGDIDHGRVFEIGREKTLDDVGNLSQLVAACSQALAHHLEQYIDSSKVTTLYTPFKIDEIVRNSKSRIKSPFKDKTSLKLIMTGNLAASKGQIEVVEAVGRLHQKGHNVELCILGSEGERKYTKALRSLLRQYGIKGRVHVIGSKRNPMPYIVAADIGVMASRQEAFGRVTFEYLVLGKPVIGTNSGGTVEMIHDGKNGYLYQWGDVAGLEAALLNYAKDAKLIEKHGDKSRVVADSMMKSEYNADNLYGKIQEVVRSFDASKNVAPINYLHREVEYSLIFKDMLEGIEIGTIKSIVKTKIRSKARTAYHYARGIKTKLIGK